MIKVSVGESASIRAEGEVLFLIPRGQELRRGEFCLSPAHCVLARPAEGPLGGRSL